MAAAKSFAAPTPTVPSAWLLEELHVLSGGFFAPAVPESASEEELAEVVINERNRLAADAYDSGFRAGQAAATAAAKQDMATAMSALRAAIGQVAASEERVLNVLEDNLAALAVSVARQIIGREVRTAPEITIDLVRLAVTEFPVDQALRIRINPLDLSAMSAAPGGEPVRIAPDREIVWYADARILPGGCVIEGRDRIIDGRVDTALERTYRCLINSAA
jgi:flagellar assembly protein FliH